MTVTFFEEMAKGSGNSQVGIRSGKTDRRYMLLIRPPYDLDEAQDVLKYAETNLGVMYGNQLQREIGTENLGGGVWMITAEYGFDEGPPIDPGPGTLLGYEYSFDTTGGTLHITQSLETVFSTRYLDPAKVRSVSDAVYNSTTTVTSATIAFTSADVGKRVTAANTPRTVNDAVVTSGSNGLTSATANFTSADVGAVLSTLTQAGPNQLVIPPGTTIVSVNSTTQIAMSKDATASAASLNLTITDVSTILPADTTIASVTNATTAILSNAATISGSSKGLTILNAPVTNFNRVIGVSKDGVAGCDKIAPKQEWQITRRFRGMTVELANNFADLTGTMNDGPFFGRSEGEQLFLGAQGAPSQNNSATEAPEVRVTFRFAVAPTLYNVDITDPDDDGNPTLRIPVKRGHDYLWVFFVSDLDPISRQNISRPEMAFVEQIYEQEDFSLLKIGTSP